MEESKTEKKLTLSEFMLKEAEDTFRMFRDDLQKVKDAMAGRTRKIEEINAEQLVDYQKRLKIEGAISACNHLVTKYKEAWMKERNAKRAKRTRTKKHGEDRSTIRTS